MSRVGENIKKVRESSGLSAKALAKKMGVSEGFLIDVEAGRRVVNESMIQRFSKILGKNVSELGLDSFETAVFKEEKETQRQARVREVQPKKPAAPAPPRERNELWDQAFGSNLKNIPVYDLTFKDPVGQMLYPVEEGKIRGVAAEKAVLLRQDSDELSGYGILKGSLLLGTPVREIHQNGFYLISRNGANQLRKIRMLGNANVLLLRSTDREISETVALKEVRALIQFVRVETALS